MKKRPDPIFDEEKKTILGTYRRYPVALVSARGKYLYDSGGRRYLDFFSGIAVTSLGHRDRGIIAAAKRQMDLYIHSSNYFYSKPQVALAGRLLSLSFPGRVFLSNSGAEANECAIKIARRYGDSSGRSGIITFVNSFHGRTLATLSATGQEKFHSGFGPMPGGFRYAAFNDIASVRRSVDRKTAAVMVEPVQGEGGVNVAAPGFMKALRNLCDEKKILLIADEVQTGLGRTGRVFACDRYGVKPDILCLGKSLAQGFPLGATIVSEKLAALMKHGDHGSTFGGNPVACAAALEFLDRLDRKLLASVRTSGAYMLRKLELLKKTNPGIVEARGLGLMLGLELERDGAPVVERCLKRGLVINCTRGKVLRFLPPLVVTRADIDRALMILAECL